MRTLLRANHVHVSFKLKFSLVSVGTEQYFAIESDQMFLKVIICNGEGNWEESLGNCQETVMVR